MACESDSSAVDVSGQPGVVRLGPLREWPRGTRKDGIYQVPGLHKYDGLNLLPMHIPSELDKIKDELDFCERDIISAGYGKTGSTWVNAILNLIVHDADTAVVYNFRESFVFIEFNDIRQESRQVARVQSMTSPRLIKTHLPYRYFRRNVNKLAKGPKIVVPMRNPKDNLVSLFHFYCNNPVLGLFDGDWNEFFELFRKGLLLYEDMFEYNLGWWNVRLHPNVHIVKYENLKKNTKKEIREIAEFLGYSMSEKQIVDIAEVTSLKNMRKMPLPYFTDESDRNLKFFRKGVVGDWRNYFTEEQSNYIDALCKEKCDPADLTFDF